jgi:hypothetical protein
VDADPRSERSVAPIIAVILMAGVAVVVGGTVTVFALSVGDQVNDVAPVAEIAFESENFGDGVAKNDTVVLTHVNGDRLERERLEVVVGDDTVFNETDNSETSGGKAVPGLVLEVDDGEFNDLNKPCRFKPTTCPPADEPPDPPGDGDGADRGVRLQWEETVQAGQSLVIQERNHPRAYNVLQPGEEIVVIYRGDDFTAVVDRATVAPDAESE